MEHTETTSLGKRIIAHRKRMGMTQDQLAERVGVSAQAVSKWENDLSCPDISILPKLAEIFGASTDELLGVTPPKAAESVFQGEVVEGAPKKGNKGEDGFHYEVVLEKKSGFWFALYIIALGALLLASYLLSWEAGFWALAWPSAMLFFGLSCLAHHLSVFGLGTAAAGAYFLLCNTNVISQKLGWSILFPALLLIWGVGLLIDSCRQKKRRFHYNGSAVAADSRCHTDTAGGYVRADVSFGSETIHFENTTLKGGDLDVSFGSYDLDLRDCAGVSADCRMDIDLSFGSLTLRVPKRYRVELRDDKTFSSVEFAGTPQDTPEAVIPVNLDISFSSMRVIYQ